VFAIDLIIPAPFDPIRKIISLVRRIMKFLSDSKWSLTGTCCAFVVNRIVAAYYLVCDSVGIGLTPVVVRT